MSSERAIRILRVAWIAVKCLVVDEGMELSGHLAFTALLAFFPFLIFLTALAGVLGDVSSGQRFINFMLDFVPHDISATIAPEVTKIFSTRQGGMLTFSAAFVLWTASSGIEAMRVALNRAYQAHETRPFWLLRLQSIAFVMVSAFVLVLLSLAVVLGPVLWRLVTHLVTASTAEAILWAVSRYAIATSVAIFAILLLHRWLPNMRRRSRELLPGVIVTVALILGAASLFSVYLATLGSYDVIYGGLGSIVAVLIYLYVNALALILGAEINSAIWRVYRRSRGTTPS